MHFWINLSVDWPYYNPLRYESEHQTMCAPHKALVCQALWHAQCHHWGDAMPDKLMIHNMWWAFKGK